MKRLVFAIRDVPIRQILCFQISSYTLRPFWRYVPCTIYWVTQKLPQICTVIFRIRIGKVAWFTVYICGNFWVTQYIHSSFNEQNSDLLPIRLLDIWSAHIDKKILNKCFFQPLTLKISEISKLGEKAPT